MTKNAFFSPPCDLEIWWMTLKNNRAPLLYYIKLCASFQIHRWTQTGVTVRKRSIQVKIGNFWSHVTLKFDGWPWKTIGHIFYAMLSFVHHFKVIGKFKLKLQSGNAQFRSKSSIFFPCDLEIWQITLKNNRTPLLYCFKHCASFHSHQWILTGVTVRKPPIWVKIDVFLSPVTLKFARWSWKTIGNLFYVASSFVHHLKAIGKLKLKSVWKRSIRVKIGDFLSCETLKFDVWPWKTIGHPFYVASSFVHHFIAISEF